MDKKINPSDIKKIVFVNQEEKAIGKGRRIGNRFERFDPNAIDGDSDGTVQEGTSFERPAGPQNMPKIKPITVPRPEEVPIKPPTPSRPTTPSKPTEVPQKPRVPSKRASRTISGSIASPNRAKEKSIANSVLDALEADQSRINNIKNAKKRKLAISNHNSVWEYAEDLLNDNFDESTRPQDYNAIASWINDFSGGMPNDVRAKARELANAYLERDKNLRSAGKKKPAPKPEPELKKRQRNADEQRKISGAIGIPGQNRFESDDDPFGEDLFSPEDMAELDSLESQVLDDLSQSIIDSVDIDAALENIYEADKDKPNYDDPREVYLKIAAYLATMEAEELPKWAIIDALDEITEFNWRDFLDFSVYDNAQGRFTLPKKYRDQGWYVDEENSVDEWIPVLRNIKEDEQEIKAIQDWLKDHPFNSEARDFEEREWADNEYDGQAERYAPTPWEIGSERSEQIDWDKLLKTAGLTPKQKEEWEYSDEELEEREALREDRLGPDPTAVAERAQIWSRVENGEGFREIAPDYPRYHWSIVRDMSRRGAEEAGKSKQDSINAERAARVAAGQRAMAAASELLFDNMLQAQSKTQLKRMLQELRDERENIRKRASNEYQMIRKKHVELWRLASELFTTMPKQNDDESIPDFSKRLRNWYFETGGHFENLAEQININHDITTATNRIYDHVREENNLIREKLSDIDATWAELQEYKKNKQKPSGGGKLSGSISVPRGVSIARRSSKPKANSTELDSIQDDLKKLLKGSYSQAASAKRPTRMNKQENSIISKVRASNRIPRGFFKPRKKPKKA